MSDERREDLPPEINPTNREPSQTVNLTAPNSQGAIGVVQGNNTQNFYNGNTNVTEQGDVVAGDKIINLEKKIAICPKPPAPPEKFGGRETELQDLCFRLKQGKLTAVDGLGGIGKTTLAKMAANVLYDDKTFRAVLWADVTRKPDLVTILDSWLKFVDPALTLPVGTEQQQASFVKSKLEKAFSEACPQCEPNRTLVVLDDVWENGLATVRWLKEACPSDGVILVTTRSRNTAINLGADSRQLNRLEGAAAREMLQLYLNFGNNTQLDELATLMGGHSLAMMLAAKRLLKKAQPVKALPEQLAEYRRKIPAVTDFKDLKLGQGEQREDNLELVLSFSYAELSEADQQHFRALGVVAHDQPFDSGILAAIWQQEDSEELEEICDRLRLLSLLEAEEQATESDNAWYRLHPLLQAYARALLHQRPAEYPEVLVRYQTHIIEITAKFVELPQEKWRQLTPYLPQVHQVGNLLVKELEQSERDKKKNQSFIAALFRRKEIDKGFLRRAQLFAGNTNNYLVYRREVQQDYCQEKWSAMGLEVSQKLEDKKLIGFFLLSIGQRLVAYGQKKEALAYYEQSLVIRRKLGDTRNEAVTLYSIGEVYAALSNNTKALKYYEQALSLIRQVDDINGEAATLAGIAGVYSHLGDKAKTLKYYEQALLLRRQVGDINGEANTLSDVACVYWATGDQTKALECLQQALPLRKQVGDIGGEAVTLSVFGLVYSALGENTKALDYYEQALTMLQQVGDIDNVATTLKEIGEEYWVLGDKAKALKYYEQALPMLQQVDRKVATINNIGLVYKDLGDNIKALEYLEQALLMLQQVGDKSVEAIIYYNISRIYYEEGQLEKAIKCMARSVDLKSQVQAPDLEEKHQLLAQWQEELLASKQ